MTWLLSYVGVYAAGVVTQPIIKWAIGKVTGGK